MQLDWRCTGIQILYKVLLRFSKSSSSLQGVLLVVFPEVCSYGRVYSNNDGLEKF